MSFDVFILSNAISLCCTHRRTIEQNMPPWSRRPTSETIDRASDASTVSSRFLIKNFSNDAPRSLNQNETSKNGGLKRGRRLISLTIENEEPCMFIELTHDVISLFLMYRIHRIMSWLEESVKLLKKWRNLQRPATMHSRLEFSTNRQFRASTQRPNLFRCTHGYHF